MFWDFTFTGFLHEWELEEMGDDHIYGSSLFKNKKDV